ncbi:unnamed protein product [Brugia timori]|uniref:Uncharacterized protein n=1 Tax=Brugia timori TaxID=42155 RepID=A0A0R3QEC1_9BILA|nr:unnamed protein product [Brugia timori]
MGRDQTVSRRSEPSSRAALIGEQPNPWDLLQPQDATSRHRGAKPSRRYGLLGMISLLSPGYLLSVERCHVRTPAPDHYLRLSSLLDPRQPPQLNYPPGTVPDTDNVSRLDARYGKSGISPVDSTQASAHASQPPAYATRSTPNDNTKVPGSFRPSALNEHLYSYCNFAGLLAETVGKSLRHSCRSELTRQGISLP